MVVLFNVDDAIFHRQQSVWEANDSFPLGVCHVVGVKVAGLHIGLERLTPIEVDTICKARTEPPALLFSVHPVAIRSPNLC